MLWNTRITRSRSWEALVGSSEERKTFGGLGCGFWEFWDYRVSSQWACSSDEGGCRRAAIMQSLWVMATMSRCEWKHRYTL